MKYCEVFCIKMFILIEIIFLCLYNTNIRLLNYMGEIMSKAKDKRINKFKRKHIWPSVLGLFIILVIFVAIALSMLVIYMLNIINMKMNDSFELAQKLSGVCVGYNESDSEYNYDEIYEYIEHYDELEAVCIMTDDDKEIWSTNNKYPDIEQMSIYTDLSTIYDYEDSTGFKIAIAEDNYHIFEKRNNITEVSEDILSKIDFDPVYNILKGNSVAVKDIIMHFKVWVAAPIDGYNIYILSDVMIYSGDVIMVIFVLVLTFLLMLVFMIYYLISIINIVSSQQKLSKAIYTDMVTGGYNWLYFEKRGNKLLKRNRGRYNYAVINLRMEKYRSFCTCFGVREGEELLEKFYLALKRNIKRSELMAHHDEADFGLLIRYIDSEELLAKINFMEKILNNVIPNIKMYFNFGVCLADNNDRNINTLYNNATIARDLLGDESENRVAFFDIEMNKRQLWERKVEDEMDKALVTKQFKLYLQPKYSTKEEKLAGAEALVRWIHPTEGFISPNRFIPIFEKNGFILQLDDYMLEEVAIQQAKWMEEGRTLFPISVNVSRAHFTREDLAEHICSIIDKYKVPHNVIELELTESAFFDDKQVLIGTVKKLRDYGFIVSMDDFGAGYSSLNSLKELSIDVLKIDADFFRGADSVERGMLIVSEVIDLAKKLDMKIVAEGIESREQVEFLAAQECDLIQGYYYAKPMPIDEFEMKYKK